MLCIIIFLKAKDLPINTKGFQKTVLKQSFLNMFPSLFHMFETMRNVLVWRPMVNGPLTLDSILLVVSWPSTAHPQVYSLTHVCFLENSLLTPTLNFNSFVICLYPCQCCVLSYQCIPFNPSFIPLSNLSRLIKSKIKLQRSIELFFKSLNEIL